MFKYLKFGNVPPAHHIAHYDGDRLLHEYCFTREGFEEPYSIFYLYHPPTAEERSEVYTEADWSHPATRKTPLLQRRHFQSDFFPPHK
ncbi:MAG: hypothetical protein ACE5EK_03075, partial [Nitrospinales bacterium]